MCASETDFLLFMGVLHASMSVQNMHALPRGKGMHAGRWHRIPETGVTDGCELANEPSSSGGAASALIHWAISPAFKKLVLNSEIQVPLSTGNKGV